MNSYTTIGTLAAAGVMAASLLGGTSVASAGASAAPRGTAQAQPAGHEISMAEFVARFGPKDPKAQARLLASGFTIRNQHSRKCLDADPGQSWDGGQVYLWECNGAEWQRWTYGQDDDRLAFGAYDGRVLDAVLRNTNGSAITRYRWRGWSDGGEWNQQWKFSSTGEIKSAWNGRCLDGDPAQSAPGTNPQRTWLWDCNGEDWQKWEFV
ncbi:RICIN domain-containing protein [Streptomyces melanogenes]|uniref:RICIN domain-containing protein n=1 Tax=Streptomyces melanogenes TaxID=67326 RepID=A0ABZ1XC09_9ACTN|nr:RICIN domain-containing protein [Streptomyces melanogenes]